MAFHREGWWYLDNIVYVTKTTHPSTKDVVRGGKLMSTNGGPNFVGRSYIWIFVVGFILS